jgi:predicted metal-binding protein
LESGNGKRDGGFQRFDRGGSVVRWLGASDAAIISTQDISVEDDWAELCLDLPCENYGFSDSCPPHVASPSGFRELLKEYEQALVFKVELATEMLVSGERQDIFRLLHKIAADVGRSAMQKGSRKSKGYAGGSCKQLFCREQQVCRVVREGGECRNPGQARPSMSGFCINVSKLLQVAGWKINRNSTETDKGMASGMGTFCGLVLVG